MKLFSIYDKKSEGYKPPFAVPTIGEAERAFLDACNTEGSDLQKHPDDYQLYFVGEFDFSSGEITPLKTHICNGASKPELMIGEAHA